MMAMDDDRGSKGHRGSRSGSSGSPQGVSELEASAMEAVEQAIRVVESRHMDNHDDDDDKSEASSDGGLLNTINLLPKFSSKGTFTTYEQRMMKQEMSDLNQTTTMMQPTAYGFHRQASQDDIDDDSSVGSASSMSSAGSSSSRSSRGSTSSGRSSSRRKKKSKKKSKIEPGENTQTAMEEFLSNPNGMNWEDLVSSMEKKRRKKSSGRSRSRSGGSSSGASVGSSSSHRKSNKLALSTVQESDEELVKSMYGNSLHGSKGPYYVEEEEIDFQDGGNGNAQPSNTTYNEYSYANTNAAGGGSTSRQSSKGYDEEWGDGTEDDADSIDFFPTFNYNDDHFGGASKHHRALPPTRSCNDATTVYRHKNRKRSLKSALCCTAVVIIVGLISGWLVPQQINNSQQNDGSDVGVQQSPQDFQDPQQSSPASPLRPIEGKPIENEGDLHALEAKPDAVTPAVEDDAANPIDGDTAGAALHIKPIALATIKKSSPTSKDGGEKFLSVMDEDRISFMRFDLSPLSKHDKIASAALHLFFTSKHVDVESTVAIELLPHGGDWVDGSVSWEEPVETKGSSRVESFSVSGSDKDSLIEVDVSHAINPKGDSVTFKLSTDANERLDFAGQGWRGGKSAPELVITLQ